MDLVLKVKDLVAAIRASDWATAIKLVLEIVTIITNGLSPQRFMASNQAMGSAFATADGRTVVELADELEDCCNKNAQKSSVAGGPLVDAVLPLLLALLKKLLGV